MDLLHTVTHAVYVGGFGAAIKAWFPSKPRNARNAVSALALFDASDATAKTQG